jgi:hypothetical protein
MERPVVKASCAGKSVIEKRKIQSRKVVISGLDIASPGDAWFKGEFNPLFCGVASFSRRLV